MDVLANFQADTLTSPQWVQYWMAVLGPVMILTVVAFLTRRKLWPAALLVFLGFPATIFTYHVFGYERIMGLGHAMFWTPAVIYLLRNRDTWRVKETLVGKWIVFAVIIMLISLVFDYFDVIRWLLGDKG